MDIRVAALTFGIVALMPASAIAAQWLTRRWHALLLIVVAALLSWWLLLQELALEDSIETEAFNRIVNPTVEQVRAFSTDTGVAAFGMFLGLPMFLLYGGLCWGLIWVSRRVWKRLVHV